MIVRYSIKLNSFYSLSQAVDDDCSGDFSLRLLDFRKNKIYKISNFVLSRFKFSICFVLSRFIGFHILVYSLYPF